MIVIPMKFGVTGKADHVIGEAEGELTLGRKLDDIIAALPDADGHSCLVGQWGANGDEPLHS